MPLSERNTSADLSSGKKFMSEAEVNQETLKRLRIQYPNLTRISGDGWYGTKAVIEEASDLLALVDTFQLEERLFEVAIHGSSPVIYLILDPSIDPKSKSYRVGRIYHRDYGKTLPPGYQTEGWDPKILSIPGESVGMGNYVIEI